MSNAIDLLSSEFSASFWYNLNSTPDRAGILVIGPQIVQSYCNE